MNKKELKALYRKVVLNKELCQLEIILTGESKTLDSVDHMIKSLIEFLNENEQYSIIERTLYDSKGKSKAVVFQRKLDYDLHKLIHSQKKKE